MFEAFWVSTGLVALGEIGDKTQLLAMMLAARYQRPWPIMAGILVATVANHLLAGLLGHVVANALGPDALRWLLGLSFLAMAAWMLVPDKAEEPASAARGLGVFAATVVAFFLAEMGDKTQVATVALAARYDSLVAVVAGSSFGLMLANVPAVWLGERIVRRLSMAWVHRLAAGLFAVLGVVTLLLG